MTTPEPHCHMYLTVTCILLSPEPHCHMYITVTCILMSPVSYCQMYITVTCIPLSQESLFPVYHLFLILICPLPSLVSYCTCFLLSPVSYCNQYPTVTYILMNHNVTCMLLSLTFVFSIAKIQVNGHDYQAPFWLVVVLLLY